MTKGHITGLWFQLARGRAMVQNRALRRARYIKDDVDAFSSFTDERISAIARSLEIRDWFLLSREGLRKVVFEILKLRLTHEVRRARGALRDWRNYRRLHLAEEK